MAYFVPLLGTSLTGTADYCDSFSVQVGGIYSEQFEENVLAAQTDGERIAKLEERVNHLATAKDIAALEARLTWKLLLWTGVWTGVLVGILKWV